MPPSGNNHRVSFPTLASQSSSHPHSNVEFDDRAESFAESDDQEKTSSFPMKQALIALFLVVLIAAVITVVVIFAKQGRDNVVQNQNQGQQGAGMGPVLPNSQSQQASSKTARSNNLSASPGTVRLDDLAKSLPGARPIATKQQAEAQSSSVHLNNPRAFAPVSISPSTPWQANNRQAARNSSDVCHGHYDKNGECLFKGFSSCGVNSRTVALTFDDGPSTDPAATRALLEELDSLGIPATFFSTPAQNGDSNEDLAPRCALVREIVSGRRVRHSVQSHSWDHRDFTSISPDELSQQMVLTEKFLETCGASPTQFRPPFGRLSPYQLRLMREKGTVIAMWNIEPADDAFEGDMAGLYRKIIEQFEVEVGEGNSAVILLHDTRYANRHGLVRKIAQYFWQRDYKFITTEECYERCSKSGPICKGRGGPRAFPGVVVP